MKILSYENGMDYDMVTIDLMTIDIFTVVIIMRH